MHSDFSLKKKRRDKGDHQSDLEHNPKFARDYYSPEGRRRALEGHKISNGQVGKERIQFTCNACQSTTI